MSIIDVNSTEVPQMQMPVPAGPPDLATSLMPTAADLETQLTTINQVEGAWGLPQLPDTVKADFLASTLMPSASDIGGFLQGIASDINAALAPDEVDPTILDPARAELDRQLMQPGRGPQDFATNMPNDALMNQARRALAGWTGARSNADIIGWGPNTAIIDAQISAVERGILPENVLQGDSLGRWTPEMRSAYYEVMRQEQDEWFAGDRPGALSFERGMELLDKWASPGSLVMSMLAASYVPDLGKIGEEFSGWGDKVGKFLGSVGDVLTGDLGEIDDLVKNAWGALGPIDDILFPLVNTAMLFSGVGSTIAFASAAVKSNRLAHAMGTFGKVGVLDDVVRTGAAIAPGATSSFGMKALGGAGRFTAAGQMANVARFSRPGIIASKLSHGRGPARAVSHQMVKWRQRTSVLVAKKATADAAKIGFTAQTQSLLSPDVTGLGLPLFGTDGTQKERLEAAYGWRTTQPIAYPIITALDTAFVPPSVFQPGTFTSPVRKATQAVAVRYTQISEDERLGAVWFTVLMDQLRNSDPEKWQRMQEMANKPSLWKRVQGKVPAKSGPHAVLVDLLGQGDPEKAGHIMSWVQVNAGLDDMARAFTGFDDDPTRWMRRYWAHRRHLTSQLKQLSFDAQTFDPTDELHVAEYMRLRAGLGADIDMDNWAAHTAKRKKIVDDLVELYDNDIDAFAAEARTQIDHHLRNRQSTFERILDGVNEGVLAHYITENVEHLDDWDDWILATEQLHGGMLENWADIGTIRPSTLDETFTGSGRAVGVVDDLAPTQTWSLSLLGEELDQVLPPSMVRDAPLTNMAKDFNPSGQGFTPARLDTPTKQDILLIAGSDDGGGIINTLEDRLAGLGRIDGRSNRPVLDRDYLKSLEEFAAKRLRPGRSVTAGDEAFGVGLEDLTSDMIRQWVDERLTQYGGQLPRDVTPEELHEYGRSVAYLAQNGRGTQDAQAYLQGLLDRINESPFWDNLGVSKFDFPTLQAKAAEARRQIEFTAAEVTGLPAGLQAQLAAKGYKAVAGVDYLQRADLIGLDGPLAEITLETLKRRSLGTFFARQPHEKVFDLRKAQAEAAIGAEVQRSMDTGTWAGPREFDTASGSDSITFVMDALSEHKAHIAKSNVESLENATGWFGRTLTRAGTNASTPMSTLDMHEKQILQALKRHARKLGRDPEEWTKQSAKIIAGATRKGKVLGWDVSGLQNLEDTLLANGVARGALKLFSYTDAADEAQKVAGWQRVLGAGNPRDELDLFRNYKRAGAMLLGGVVGAVQAENFDRDPVTGALAGAGGAGVLGEKVVNIRTVSRLFSAQMTGRAVQGATDSDIAGLTAGMLMGTVGMGAMRAGATAAVKSGGLLDKMGWANYSKLGDNANRVRNLLRFSLSPVFDAQRYTEGMMLLQTSEFGDDIPVTFRIMKSAEKLTDSTADEILAGYRAALRSQGEEWFEAIEDTQRYFRDEGILGFSPSEWQAAAWAHIRHRNPTMSAADAAERVQNILTYGTKGRSGLEQSVNFVFFPFSFQKKYLTQLATFAADDVGRVMLIHEGLKMYEILDDQYNLTEQFQDRLPVLDQMRKFNALAMGFSLGEFGGINRPYFDILNATPVAKDAIDSIGNLFIPQAMRVNTYEDSRGLMDRARRVLPVWRDSEDLLRDVMDQGQVITSPSHLSRAAQNREAWEEYGQIRDALTQLERAHGVSVQTMLNRDRPEFGLLQTWYREKINDLNRRYPTWQADRDRVALRRIQKAQDINNLRNQETLTQAQQFVITMQDLISETEQVTREAGMGDFGADLDLMPTNLQDGLRSIAADMARRDPSFIILYDRYFKSTLGPITLGVR